MSNDQYSRLPSSSTIGSQLDSNTLSRNDNAAYSHDIDNLAPPTPTGLNSSSLKRGQNLQSSTMQLSQQLTPSSLKELKKNYHMKKKVFTRNVQSAIESTQEVHSGWLKARTTFKRWTKVWCQVKPGYLILYTSQEALKKHRLGVVLLPVCQIIKRPTKKEGYCFKLINPLGCSVWAKSSTRALVFAQASLTLRVSDSSIGKLWLDALHRCNLSTNLEGYRPFIDDDQDDDLVCNFSDSDDGDQSTKQLDSMLLNHSNTTSDSNSISSFRNPNNCTTPSGKPFLNGNDNFMQKENLRSRQVVSSRLGDNNNDYPVGAQRNTVVMPSDKLSSQQQSKRDVDRLNNNSSYNNNNNNVAAVQQTSSSATTGGGVVLSKINCSKMVAKFSKYNWKELQLEKSSYICDEAVEELGTVGMQSEEVHESNKNFLWHIIKQLRPGMDLSKVTLPTFILEPRSFLEKLADYYYHCDILSEAVLIDDPALRLINIVKWYLSGFYKKPKGPKKPYNPILGERFRCFWEHPKTQSRTFFVAEQVSHHPPISAFHVSNRKDGYTITCALLSRSKYGGNSVSAILDGKARLHLTKRNETYTLTMPYANCRGILLGSLTLELGGKVEIECAQTRCKCELDFKIAPMWASANSYNSLTGRILMDNKVTHTLDGHWDKKINIVDKRTEEKLPPLWEVTDRVRSSRLKRYTVSLSDQDDRESVKLWSKVSEALTANDQTLATAEKTRLEDMQRQEARERKNTFMPQHFQPPKTGSSDWSYKWQDNRAWDCSRDIMQFEEEFRIRTLMLEPSLQDSTQFNPSVDLALTQLSKFTGQLMQANSNNNNNNLNTLLDEQAHRGSSGGAAAGGVGGRNGNCKPNRPPIIDQDTFKTIESRIVEGNLLFEEAIKQVNEKNKRLEEDIALLKRARGKRTMAFFMTAIIVALLGAFFRYFA